MSEISRQKFIHNLLVSKTFLFLLLLLTIWVALACVKIAHKRYQMAREIDNIQKEIEQLKKDNQTLSVLINSFNNPSYLEKEAKRRLNLRKEGEEVVILPQQNIATTSMENGVSVDENNNQRIAEKNKTESKEEPNFWKWWKYFFH
jgi:cell division protein FtsL